MKMREQTLLAGEYCTLDGFFYIKEALLLLTALQWFYGEKLVWAGEYVPVQILHTGVTVARWYF